MALVLYDLINVCTRRGGRAPYVFYSHVGFARNSFCVQLTSKTETESLDTKLPHSVRVFPVLFSSIPVRAAMYGTSQWQRRNQSREHQAEADEPGADVRPGENIS